MLSPTLLDVKTSSGFQDKMSEIVKITKNVKKEILTVDIEKKKSWIPNEILKLMEDKRKKKMKKDMNVYKLINNQIRGNSEK